MALIPSPLRRESNGGDGGGDPPSSRHNKKIHIMWATICKWFKPHLRHCNQWFQYHHIQTSSYSYPHYTISLMLVVVLLFWWWQRYLKRRLRPRYPPTIYRFMDDRRNKQHQHQEIIMPKPVAPPSVLVVDDLSLLLDLSLCRWCQVKGARGRRS